LESVKKLAKKGIELEDIIDDINKRSESFYTIALLWHLNIVQQLIEEHGGKAVARVKLTLSEWISQNASPESIGNYISYLIRRENGELTKKNIKPSYETSIHEIKTRYSLE
jgi:phosphoribosyl-ATP pyrophosphohydrolase